MTIIKVAQVKPEHLTIKAARNRFTLAEKIAIETAAETSPLVRTFLADMSASRYIDRLDPQFLESLQALEQAGLLEEGRALEIQEAPVQEYERHTGA